MSEYEEVYDHLMMPQVIRGLGHGTHGTVMRAIRIATAVEKDIAEGCVMIPSELTEDMAISMHESGGWDDSVDNEHISEWNTEYKAAVSSSPQSHLSKVIEHD